MLPRLGAPEEVVAYVRALGGAEDAPQRCRRGDVAVWIAAARGASLRHLVEAAAACARLPVEREPEALVVVTELIDSIEELLLEGEGDLDAVVADAEDLEKRAAQPPSYRDPAPASVIEAYRSASWPARAVEALGVTAARFFHARELAARYTAALLGSGIGSMMPRAEEIGGLDPDRVEADPIHGDLPFVVAAAAQAVAHAARALAGGDDAALEAAHAECAELFRAALADLAPT